MIDILEDYCQYRQYGYCRIDGNTSGEDRESQIDDYNKVGGRGPPTQGPLLPVPPLLLLLRSYRWCCCRCCCRHQCSCCWPARTPLLHLPQPPPPPPPPFNPPFRRAPTSLCSCCPPAPAAWASTCTQQTSSSCTTPIGTRRHAGIVLSQCCVLVCVLRLRSINLYTAGKARRPRIKPVLYSLLVLHFRSSSSNGSACRGLLRCRCLLSAR